MSLLLDKTRAPLRALWMMALSAFALSGCGGGGAPPTSTAADPRQGSGTGTLLISLTDADGDFVGYSVDVLSVTLQRRGGGTVEVLPGKTRIDFAQLTDLSDLLAVATLAPGDIDGGKIRLDYGTAEVFVQSGGQVARADVIDGNGAPLGIVDLDIQLAARNHLVITRGRAASLLLDFDLATSHTVDTTRSPPVVTARPFVVAEAQPVTEKELRLRGTLVSTDVAAGTYTVDVRPWFRPDGNHGNVTVHTDSTTSFEIDGTTTTGAAGLAALAAKPAGTMTVAFGTLTTTDHTFTAEIVHVGGSVSGEGLDAIHGNIVARQGNQLTVKGAFAVRRDRATRLHRTVVVTVGPATKVLKSGWPGVALDDTALSVGQNVVAFGSLTEPATDTTPASFDATDGRVRMLPTHLHGKVKTIAPGQLNLELRGIDRLGIALFDFTGTGSTAAQDANPADYEVATGALGLNGLAVGESAKVIGFVRPFAAAPPDFDGRAVISQGRLPAMLGIGWASNGTTAPFLSLSATGLVLDLTNPAIGERHVLFNGSEPIDLRTLAGPPTIAPASGRLLLGIGVGRDIRLFATFAEFTTELAAQLSAGKPALALVAVGSYDEATTTLNANHVAVQFAGTN